MENETMPLSERIEAAIKRITTGQAAMRVPVDATDPDMVLRDANARIAELEALAAEAGAALETIESVSLACAKACVMINPHGLLIEVEPILAKLDAAGLMLGRKEE